jgi:predicted kinase
MKRGLLTVVDATSLRAANRARYRAIAARHRVPVIAVAFDYPDSVFHGRNRGRAGAGRVVDDAVVEWQIEQMRKTVAALPEEGYAAVYLLRDPEEQVEVARGT